MVPFGWQEWGITPKRFLVLGAIFLGVIAFSPVLVARVYTYGDLPSYFLAIVRAWAGVHSLDAWLWSDRIVSGYPTIANPQLNLAYLPDWFLSLPVSPLQALTLNICFHAWIAGFGFLVWLRDRGLGKSLSLSLAVLFMVQGVAVSLHHMIDNLQALVWAPWITWSFLRCQTPLGALGFFAFAWLAMGAGDPQMILLMGLAGVPWIFGYGKRTWIASLLVLGALAAQPWLLAFLEVARVGERGAGIQSLQNRPWGLDPALLATFVLPSTLQHPWDGVSWIPGAVRPNWLQSLYIGLIPLLLFWRVKLDTRLRWIALVVIQGTLAVLAIKGWAPIDQLRESIPLISMVRFPSRWVLMLPVALLFLAGEFLAQSSEWTLIRPRSVALGAFVLMGCAIVAVSLGYAMDIGDVDRLQSWWKWATWDLVLGLLPLSAFMAAVWKRRHGWLVLALALEALLGVKVAVQYATTSPSDNALSPKEFDALPIPDGQWAILNSDWDSSAWVAKPKRPGVTMPVGRPSKGMIAIDIDVVPGTKFLTLEGYRDNWAMPFVLRPARTSTAVGMFYAESLHIAENIAWHGGVRFSLTRVNPDGTYNSPFIQHPGKSIALLRNSQQVLLASEHRAVPRIHLFSKIDTSSDWNRVFERDPIVDPVARIDGAGCRGAFGAAQQGPLLWRRISSTRYEVDARGHKGVLTLAQDRYPGWLVVVDGVESVPKVVNILQMGVCLDGTVETVVFEYRPTWWKWIPIQLALFLLVAVSSAILLFRYQRTLRVDCFPSK